MAVACSPVHAIGGRLLGTGGATQVEGSAGGGIVPWAVIAGYGTEDERGGTAAIVRVDSDDFALTTLGVAYGWNNRVEASLARQSLDAGTVIPGLTLRQQVAGIKVRIAGDLVYTTMPQLAVGLQYKWNLDFAVPAAAGAGDDSGIDVYLAATKLFLAGIAGRHALINATLRSTAANQTGLLGFGGDRGGREWVLETSAAVLVTESVAVGFEFRQKSDNLSFAGEDHWRDVFIAWFPDKRISVVAAWADLGSIAGVRGQTGTFISAEVNF